MSSILTLPVSAGDHGEHSHTHSGFKSNTRHGRSSTRLAPPIGLPRIPSGSVSPEHDDPVQFEPFSYQPGHRSRVSHAPETDPNAVLIAKKRSFEVTKNPSSCAGNHTHRHVSRPTELLLNTTENYSLLHGILADHDSRRIFYFMILNLAFMVVQSTYGYLTGSLGLISDSIHMFFDCVALLVGLCAAVMSKWPPSAKFPYGYGKIDTLAGLGNGIFLMLISVEIIFEAVERLSTGADVSRTTELLAVSTAGLAVNLVGILAFHGHHGHGHGHDHGHGHSHSHSHDHGHDHSHLRSHSHHSRKGSDASFVTAVTDSPAKRVQSASGGHHSHSHGHGSENMQGIYLHIMADALGSVSVVISTILVKFTDWSGWDPIASVIIAALIFISTIPLISSTTKILLLSLNSDIEYNLRDILSGVSDIKGVVGYTVPKFWLEDIKKESGHDHHHDHSAHHGHGHNHTHTHSHHRHDSKDSDQAVCDDDNNAAVLGVIHIIANPSADLGDVRNRVSSYFNSKKMDVVVQVEREGESRCFCGGGLKSN